MGTVTATAETIIHAEPEVVLAALADYRDVRPTILTGNYSDYAVEAGGVGAGTVATWRLQATKSRVRHVVADITTSDDSVTETDRNSTMVTTFRVSSTSAGARVVATTTWQGAGGIGGIFERIFAPLGLRRIHGELLSNLAVRVQA